MKAKIRRNSLKTELHLSPSAKNQFRHQPPLIFKDYKKILFTDVDLVFDKDPALIYDIDTNNSEIAAVKDPIMSGYYKSEYKTEVYLKNVLCMSEPLEYLNTGVMLFNVDAFSSSG